MHPYVGEETYCCDWAYLHDSDDCVLVELSPFRPCTGAACFRWDQDNDLLHGRAPFEFRVNREEHPQLGEIVSCNWDERWATEVPPYQQWFPQLPTAHATSSSWIGGMLRWLWAAWPTTTAATAAAPEQAVPAPPSTLLFVYGTLKEGFHWHAKFLSFSTKVGVGSTAQRYPLVVGESGVPYLLGDMPGCGQCVQGELWRVDADTLEGLDEYEGLRKGHYDRRRIEVLLEDGAVATADAYFKVSSSAELRASEHHSAYSLEMHRELYRPIRHIEVKQQLYVGDIIQPTPETR